MRADVRYDDGVPVVTVPENAIAFAASVSRLTEVAGRWSAEGGMFDGCEHDFEGSGADRRFFGGLYPFELVADDDRQPIALPLAVDEHGDVNGAWAGEIDTPFGSIPMELHVDGGRVQIALLGVEAVDSNADTGAGWIRAHLALDDFGFGALVILTRLGLTDDRVRGLLYVRHPGGELTIPAELERGTA
jgi:hypothetical protein